jgi:hypothetical protein
MRYLERHKAKTCFPGDILLIALGKGSFPGGATYEFMGVDLCRECSSPLNYNHLSEVVSFHATQEAWPKGPVALA